MMFGMNMIELPSYLTVAAAAVRAGVDPSTVLRWIKDGKLAAHVPITGARERPTLLLWAPDVDRFTAARRVVAGSEPVSERDV